MDTEARIREIPPGEAPWDLLLLADPCRETVEAYLPRSRCFALCSGVRILGVCAVLSRGGGVHELMNLAVEPSSQGTGLGTRLLRHVTETLGREGARRLELGTGSFGYQLRFYQRCGFRVREVDRDYFPRNYPETIMEEGVWLRDRLLLDLEYPVEGDAPRDASGGKTVEESPDGRKDGERTMAKTPIETYRIAADRVPAYRRFLEERCGVVPEVRDLEDFRKLPFMDKPGYVAAYPLEDRCLDGTLKGKHLIAHSSGSSGRHTPWPMLPELEKGYWQRTYDELERNYRIRSRSTLVILGVLMGGNLSGALFAYALRAVGIETGEITLVTPGRDEEGCLEALREYAPLFEQTVLFSYGATAKNVLETAEARGIPVKDLHVKLRLLGEGYSEAFRDRINELLGYPYGTLDSVVSGYGATDFRNVGKETPLCVAIRRILHEQGLLGELLGLDAMPTLCQITPGDLFLEEVEGELVMTRYNAVPLVRYRSGDGGRLLGFDELVEPLRARGHDPLRLLAERGHDPALSTRDPFVLVTGRLDGLAFCGTKILISQVKEVLEGTPYLAARFSGEFQMKRSTDENQDPHLDLALVPRPDAPDLDPAEASRAFAEALAAGRGGIYAQVLADRPHLALPRVRFVRREEIMTPQSFKIRYIG